MKMEIRQINTGFHSRPFGLLTLAVALGLGACQTGTSARSDEKTNKERFNAVDTNHDGMLSLNETSDYYVSKIFDGIDTNHDGSISQEEWVGSDNGRLPEFRRRDLNHDGIIRKQEAEIYGRKYGLMKKVMVEADKDRDGKLSFPEAQAYFGSREGPPPGFRSD